MLAYYLLIGVPLLLSVFEGGRRKEGIRKKLPIIIFFVLFIVLLSLRDIACGSDLSSYYSMYTLFDFRDFDSISFKSLFDFSSTEAGFKLVEKIIYNLTQGNFQVFIAVCAIISLVPICVLYCKESKHSVLTIILFISIAPFSMFFSGLRQSLAMGIGVLCYYFVKNKKLIFFLLLVFVCFLFHQSSLVLLLMYPIYRLKLDKNKVWFLIPIIIALLLLNRFIFSSSISLLGRYGDRYASTSSTGAYGTLLLLIVFLFFSFFITDEKKITPDAKGLRNLLIIMVLIQCFAPVHSVAMRLNYYYLLFIPIIIPKMIDCRANKMSSIANMSTYVMCTFFCGYFFYKAYFGADLLQIFPYIPMWARW